MALADTIIALTRGVWRKFAERGRTPDGLYASVDAAIALSDSFSREILARNIPDLNRIACTQGCAWCCHYQVGVTAPQALHIAAKLKEGAGTRPLDAQRQRLKALDARTRGLNAAKRLKARLGCAFLNEQNACTIYAFRPFGCRGANSIDADTCKAFVAGTATKAQRDGNWLHKVPFEAQRDLQDGFHMGALENGLRDDRLELTAAILVALETSDAAERWITGEDVFKDARLPPD
jgi:Fe-S-cluster containining protein